MSASTWLLARIPLRWMFEVFYLSSSDPWSYWKAGFEAERYQRAIDLLREGAPPGGWESRMALEVGCSVGAFTRRLTAVGFRHVVAVDISRIALRRARRALESREADLTSSLPPASLSGRSDPSSSGAVTLDRLDVFRDAIPGRFDLVVATDVLGYTDDDAVLAGARDRLLGCLSPDGRLLLGNTKLRARDGEGWEPFPSGFPRRGAGELIECFRQAGAAPVASYEEPRFRMDLLRSP